MHTTASGVGVNEPPVGKKDALGPWLRGFFFLKRQRSATCLGGLGVAGTGRGVKRNWDN